MAANPKIGREIDLAIAEHVLGHSISRQKSGLIHEGTPKGVRPLRFYSREIEAAWEVVDKVGITLIPIEGGQWFALVGPRKGWQSPAEIFEFLQKGEFVDAGAAVADNAPTAICLAAIKANEKTRAILSAIEEDSKRGPGLKIVPDADEDEDSGTGGQTVQ